MAGPASFVGSCRTTADRLHELLDIGGVNFEQPSADSDSIEVAFSYPAPNGAVVDVAAVRRFLQANQFRMPTLTTIGRWAGRVSGHGGTFRFLSGPASASDSPYPWRANNLYGHKCTPADRCVLSAHI